MARDLYREQIAEGFDCGLAKYFLRCDGGVSISLCALGRAGSGVCKDKIAGKDGGWR